MDRNISLIAALARNRVIGVENELPWHLPEDLQRFKTLTLGKPVIMGRKTFQSIESRLKRPLPGRPNIVISGAGFSYPGVDVYPDLETALSEARFEFPADELMVIGGASVYAQALPLVTHMYLTILERDERGDAWFPDFDKTAFREKESEQRDGFKFVTYERLA